MNGVWLTIKIYPVCETQDLGKIFSKEVFQCADTYTEELESLSKSNFFLHYMHILKKKKKFMGGKKEMKISSLSKELIFVKGMKMSK